MVQGTFHTSRAGAGACMVFAGLLASGAAQATYIAEIEANDTFATAQVLDGSFSLDFDADIGDLAGNNTSTTLAHASVRATGNATLDIYSFTVAVPGSRVILDIDYGAPGFDSALWLFSAADLVNELRNDWDTTATAGAGGSVANLGGGLSDDSFIEEVVAADGVYYALVGRQATGAPGYDVVPDGASYILHVSVERAAAVPSPAMLPLFATGLLGFAWSRRAGC
jgi:hypothetical protein